MCKSNLEMLNSHRTSSKNTPQERSVVWLYPDHSGDERSSFLLADGECKRLATSALGGKSKANLLQFRAG